MADQIETLKQLQQFDGELYRLRQQQREKPRELEAVQAQVAAQEARTKGVEDRLRSLQLAQKEKEMELQTREGNVKKLQGQLFQLKTNKEYAAMQREIDVLKAENSLLEEAILKTFDAIDQASKERQQEQRRLAEEQARLQLETTRVTEVLAPAVPPATLATYERILKIREGLALVPLMENACGGCHRRMPPQVINEVYLKAKLVTCESCTRILYFDEAYSKL